MWLLLVIGFALLGVWIAWQPPWSLPIGFTLIMLATVVAGGKHGTGIDQ